MEQSRSFHKGNPCLCDWPSCLCI